MKILVLGGDGMLGHTLFEVFGARHEVKVTLRRELALYAGSGLFSEMNAFDRIDARDPARLPAMLAEFGPQAVVNAVGLVKQRADGGDVIANLEINALFPHRLAQMCAAAGAKLVHISTDGVFSGGRGNYREEDRPDPPDLYGQCKLLGEPAGQGAITLRTAVIGLGLTRRTGLIDWFLQQRGPVPGYRNALFSGVTARELSRAIEMLVTRFPHAKGLYHFSTAVISKYDLLLKVRDRLKLSTEIVADDSVRIDRSLDSTRFRAEFSYAPPSWDGMLEELAGDIRARQA
jgi:dTDP-4-dehydrorhamnose reductase